MVFLFENIPDEKEIIQWTFINNITNYYWYVQKRIKEELNIKNGLTAIAKHIVETQILHWTQLTKSLDM